MSLTMPEDFVIKILTSFRNARIENHRRLVVLMGNNDEKIIATLAEILKLYAKNIKNKRINILYTYHKIYEDAQTRKNMFGEALKNRKNIFIDFITYPDTAKVLGLTYDIAVLDLINDLKPNDIGRLTGIVRGGGVLFFLMPSFEVFLKKPTRFQENLITIGYSIRDLRNIFKKRFIRKLREYAGIIIYDVDKEHVVQEDSIKDVKPYRRGKLIIPERGLFPRKIYELALTQDQVNVLKILENLYEKPENEKIIVVVTADRGRGKSCAVGIGVAALAYKLRRAKGRARIVVTAPNIGNVQSFFDLAIRALKVLGQKVEVERNQDDFIYSVKAKGIELEYYTPLEALRRGGDIIVADEAAGLQVPMLFGIYRRFSRMIFASTIHGYEGAGRGFSVRFLQLLRRDPRARVFEYEMNEPIRYSLNDPVEKWLFDTLLLDAEPASLTTADISDIEEKKITYLKPSLENFFLENEKKLRQFVGIYIMAHYRNNPDDIGMMMDAPHHEIRALQTNSNENIVTSVELAEEGGIPREIGKDLANGEWVAGNIIPDRFMKHYRVLEFGELKGWRIVRIATHPEVQSRGLGSCVLEFICQEARERGYDWVGAGFGVNVELLRFWIKNGFIPIHISPERNPVSGEYTVIVIKPLTKRAYDMIRYANKEFRVKLLNSLIEPYHDLNPQVARLLLSDWGWSLENIKLDLTDVQRARLMSYAWGLMTLENCFDTVLPLVKYYFSRHVEERPGLDDLEEKILITRVLQAKSWKITCDQLKLNPPTLINKLRDIIKKLCEYYLGANEEKLKKYFIKIKT